MEIISDDFNKLTEFPTPFLNGDEDVSSEFIKVVRSIYKLSKLLEKTRKNDPFPQLLTEGFDEEQIWQQIDLFNSSTLFQLQKQISGFENTDNFSLQENAETNSVLVDDLSDDGEIVDSIEYGESDEDPDDETQASHEQHEEPELFEKTIVDDKFFSLRQMEKFLNNQEAPASGQGDDDDIDYFDEIPSTDDEGELSDEDSEQEDHTSQQNAGDEDHISARQLKYQDFYDAADQTADEQLDADTEAEPKIGKQDERLTRKIVKLEERALAEPDWQMRGETTASKRPVNSLLEEVLQFDQTQRSAPEITDEHTHDLESVICQRIKERAWDDVQRKIKETKNLHEFKKKIVLNSEQSKLSLHEIYEKEYLNKISGQAQEEKENPDHVELKSLMKDLFRKLDALSNFHFRAAQPEPEIKVIKNLPAIAMEEVQPISHAESNMLAPEEIHGQTEDKANAEKTSTDKKRERRKKKAKQKARAKVRSEKLQALAETNEKLKSLQAIHKLEQQAKLPGSQTTIVKASSKQRENLTSSKSFFGKLEERKSQKPFTKKKPV